MTTADVFELAQLSPFVRLGVLSSQAVDNLGLAINSFLAAEIAATRAMRASSAAESSVQSAAAARAARSAYQAHGAIATALKSAAGLAMNDQAALRCVEAIDALFAASLLWAQRASEESEAAHRAAHEFAARVAGQFR
jgi:hypothetical protein